MFPLVNDVNAKGYSITMICRVLGLNEQVYYRWKRNPVTNREITEAYRMNAVFNLAKKYPKYGYRMAYDVAVRNGESLGCERSVYTARKALGLSAKIKARPKRYPKAGGELAKDRVRRDFFSDVPDRVWLTDITEFKTGEGKVYLCAVKDTFSHAIIGLALSSRMKASLAVAAVEDALSTRGYCPQRCVIHSEQRNSI